MGGGKPPAILTSPLDVDIREAVAKLAVIMASSSCSVTGDSQARTNRAKKAKLNLLHWR